MKLGQLVLVRERDVPPMKCPSARLCEIYPENDRVIRAVTVQYHGSLKKQAGSVNLCPLPVEVPNEQGVFPESMPAKQKRPAFTPTPNPMKRKIHSNLTTVNPSYGTAKCKKAKGSPMYVGKGIN